MALVPPIKSQGIKTKLVEWIKSNAQHASYDRWVEPFMGTGVVAFNVQPKAALLCDSNPHLIEFYKAVQAGDVTSANVRPFLIEEGTKLLNTDGEHYYMVRERFNASGDPLDFLFLSRSCFNGMMRFNKKGGFNVPFCRKPNRFAQALVTKICNQVDAVSRVIQQGSYSFVCQDFQSTLSSAQGSDLIYCDPPYIGRHVDYFDSWSEAEELLLEKELRENGCHFIMSTWLENKYRKNDHVFSTWADYNITTKEHFYHVGGKEKNRNAVVEALLMNFKTPQSQAIKSYHEEAPVVDVTGDQQTLELSLGEV